MRSMLIKFIYMHIYGGIFNAVICAEAVAVAEKFYYFVFRKRGAENITLYLVAADGA